MPEGEYVYSKKKPFIPLLMQKTYISSGWLGIIVGAKFYIDFDGKFTFDEAFTLLEKELDGRGKELVKPTVVGECYNIIYIIILVNYLQKLYVE